jgi:serine/threonine-protein kinase
VVAALCCDLLAGLHAAHEARNEQGAELAIVHRDVSPQNVLVGLDGVARVLDFGIAKAAIRLHTTRDGQIKGKLRYMAPEQIMQMPVDRRTDVYAAAVVGWEALAGRRLFPADEPGAIVKAILDHEIPALGALSPWVPAELDAVFRRGLEVRADARFATALEMAEAIERVVKVASPREVGAWVRGIAEATLAQRAAVVARIEQSDPDEPVLRRSEADLALPAAPLAPSEPTGATEVGGGKLREDATTSTGSSLSGDVLRASADVRRARWPRIAAAAIAIALFGGGWFVIGRRGAEHASSLSPPAEPVPSSSTAAPAPAVANHDATAQATAPGAASSVSATSPPPASPPPRNAGPRPPRATPPGPGAKNGKKPGCDPPYVIEADGTKVFKSGCL